MLGEFSAEDVGDEEVYEYLDLGEELAGEWREPVAPDNLVLDDVTADLLMTSLPPP